MRKLDPARALCFEQGLGGGQLGVVLASTIDTRADKSLIVASAADDFESILASSSQRHYGAEVARFSGLVWNVRRAPLPFVGPGAVVEDALRTLAPAVAVLLECPRYAFPRGATEPTPDFPYRFLISPGGGDQRIVIAYDTRRVRLKERIKTIDGPFTRPPLWAHFALLQSHRRDPVDLQVVGVHFKSQGGDNSKHRVEESEALGTWVRQRSMDVDADLVIMGDWNSSVYDEDLDVLNGLEQQGLASFISANGSSEVGVLLRQVRKRPRPENIVGECFLDTRYIVRSRFEAVGLKRAIALEVNLVDLVKGRGDSSFVRWLNELAGAPGAKDLAPQLLGLCFREFESEAF